MIRKPFFYTTIATLVLIIPFFVVSARAGQVVTKEDKTQAQAIIRNEKILQPTATSNTVAVLYFRNQTGNSDLDALQKGIALMLITDLSKVESLQVVERIQLQALVEELGLGASGLVEPGTAPRIGKLLQARWIIGGEILKVKLENLRIQSDVTDTQTKNSLGQPVSEGKPQDLIKVEKDILFGIIPLLKIEPTARESEKLKIPCSTNLQALMALFKGVDASDKGNYNLAADYYEAALKEDANICIARGAIEELQQKGLVGGKKKSSGFLKSLRDRTSFSGDLTPPDATRREGSPTNVRRTRSGSVFTGPARD